MNSYPIMKNKFTLLLVALGIFQALSITAAPMGTAFTYQGRLHDGAQPANGNYDFTFTLHDDPASPAALGTSVSLYAVPVTNGLFTVELNASGEFGPNAFNGEARWLQTGVRTNCNCLANFTFLHPRQHLTPAPHALFASAAGTANQLTSTLPSAQLAGTYSSALTLNNAGNSFSGSGAGLTSLNASQLTSGTVPDARLGANVARTNQVWLLGGNAGTGPAQYLGTTDNQPLDIRVNTQRALRLEPNPGSVPNVIGGMANNTAGVNSPGAAIGGGSLNTIGTNSPHGVVAGGRNNHIGGSCTNATVGGGNNNSVVTNANYAVIGGGIENVIDNEGDYSVIGGGWKNRVNSMTDVIAGGWLNTIHSRTFHSAISGGYGNTIESQGDANYIAGGAQNLIGLLAQHCAIGGGSDNRIDLFAQHSTIAGGSDNTISRVGTMNAIGGGYYNSTDTNAYCAVISGGLLNKIGTNTSSCAIGGGAKNSIGPKVYFATIPGGHRGHANHSGTFVWGDSTDADISSTSSNSVTMRASGGYRLFSNAGASAGVSLAPGGTAWAVISDRDAKKDFAPVDSREILEKLAALPITQWHYRWEESDATPHLGPMAQDFKAAFYPGRDDKSITTLEADGVALAAIQGLNQKLEAQRAENNDLRRELEELKQLVGKLTRE